MKAIFSFFSTYKVFFNYLSLKERESQQTFSIIFYQENRTTAKNIELINLLIQYREIPGEFEKVVKWWIENEIFISHGLRLYLQLVNLKIESPVQQFLSIVFALETLHASFFDKKLFTDSEMSKFKEERKKFEMDPVFGSKFDECLLHFNSMSFRQRMMSMIQTNIDLFEDYIDDANDFAKKITNKRNYYAHKHSLLPKAFTTREDFNYYTMISKLIFEVTFLTLIGIRKEAIKLMLKRNHVYDYYKKNKRL